MPEAVAGIRAFNRFYTRTIGVLQEGVYHRSLSLTEARVLYELAQREATTASEIAATLGIDRGYLSRIFKRFAERHFVHRGTGKDRRQNTLTLTAAGRREFRRIDRQSDKDVAALIAGLSAAERQQLAGAMKMIESLLGGDEPAAPFILRLPDPGDYGWVVQRHGAIYAAEYGWNEEFEALVAEIVARFIRTFDPRRERCWIAERNGQNAGCVFVVKRSSRVAQLRCLLVEPSARGHGIGERLVQECIHFARDRGYRKMMLWTNSVLHAARRIYQKFGFQLVAEEPRHIFGHDLVSQNWELTLSGVREAPPTRPARGPRSAAGRPTRPRSSSATP